MYRQVGIKDVETGLRPVSTVIELNFYVIYDVPVTSCPAFRRPYPEEA